MQEGLSGFYRGVMAPLAGQMLFRTLMFSINAAYTREVVQNGSLLGRMIPSLDGGGKGAPLRYSDYAFGGSIAWAVGTVVECPINSVASQMQVAVLRAQKPEFPTVWAYMRGAPARYGVAAALYPGFAPHLLRNFLGGAFHLGAFEWARREYAAANAISLASVPLPITLAAGGLGGILYWTLTYPIDCVKGVLQADELCAERKRYKGALHAARVLWAEGGIARFWRGFTPCIIRAVPANAVVLTSGIWARDEAYKLLGVGGIAG